MKLQTILVSLISTWALLFAIGCEEGNSGRTVNNSNVAGDSGASGTDSSAAGPGGDTTLPDNGTFDTDECDNTVLDMTIRDFNESHPDFNPTPDGDSGGYANVLSHDLGTDGKPVLLNPTSGYWHWMLSDDSPLTAGGITYNKVKVNEDGTWAKNCWNSGPGTPEQCHQGDPVFTTADNFNQWYNDVDGVNQTFTIPLELFEDSTRAGIYYWDSNEHGVTVGDKKQFFPLADGDGWGPGPSNGNPYNKNFLFTTEIAFKFVYKPGQQFTFRGDDDLWIFVNNKLALDLGGLHMALEATLDFDAKADELGITPGHLYTLKIFHAERKPMESNFRIETDIDCFIPIDII